MRPLLPQQEDLGSHFSYHDIKAACLLLKPGKAPDPDGIYNQFLTHVGPNLPRWATCNFNCDVLTFHARILIINRFAIRLVAFRLEARRTIKCYFTVCFNTNHVPKFWRRASIVAILKLGKM